MRTLGKTCVSVSYPWGLMHAKGTRLLCSDGKIRAPKHLASSPDTFFSTPCSMRIKGRHVSGYMTEIESFVPPNYADVKKAFVFCAHTNQVNASLLPSWPDRFSQECFDLLADVETEVEGRGK